MERKEIVRLVKLLEDEVDNGGFDQFFFNSGGDEIEEMIEGLQKIGALKTADIAKRAAAKFPGGMPPKDRFVRQDVLLDIVSPEADAFYELDQEFFAHPDDISALLAKYGS